MEIQYLGTRYKGWQKQDNANLLTVQGVIEKMLRIILRYEVALYAAGRTDAGVHAIEQCAHFDAHTKLDFNKFIYSMNALLKEETICIKNIKAVPDDFHARFSCTSKTYIYNVLPSKTRNIFFSKQYWQIPKISDFDLFITKANECTQFLIGQHDFSSFQDAACQAKSPIRTIDECQFLESGEFIVMHISARSFLQHQIRIIMGTILQIIIKNEPACRMQEILQMRDRRYAGITAPADGLFLKKIVY